MAEPEVEIDPTGDEEMAEVEVVEEEGADEANPSGLEDIEPAVAERVNTTRSQRSRDALTRLPFTFRLRS
jgi:hypothetical protein